MLVEPTMASLTPQEKKRLSYAHDRRNSYGENSKSSRKAIPQRKKRGRRALRRDIQQAVSTTLHGAGADEDATSVRLGTPGRKKETWQKAPDIPLAASIQRKKKNRVKRINGKKRRASDRTAVDR